MYAIHTLVQYTKCNKKTKYKTDKRTLQWITSQETVHKYNTTPKIFDKQILFDIYAI